MVSNIHRYIRKQVFHLDRLQDIIFPSTDLPGLTQLLGAISSYLSFSLPQLFHSSCTADTAEAVSVFLDSNYVRISEPLRRCDGFPHLRFEREVHFGDRARGAKIGPSEDG